MKKKLIIAVSCILILSIAIIIFIIAYSSKYDRVARDDEKTILFFRTRYSPFDHLEYSILAVDNHGNVYLLFTQDSVLEVIENDMIFEGDIVGNVPVDEVMRYYNRFIRIREDIHLSYVEGLETGMEPHFFYYGVGYKDGVETLVRIGERKYVANNRNATEITEWIEDWEWSVN